MVFWNVWFNVEWNRVWAYGNYWLVGNTIFILFEFFDSLGLVFELPVFLRAMRVTRYFAFWGAIAYVTAYVMSAFEWYDQLYIVTDMSQYDFVTIASNMFLGYNIVLHGSIIPICLVVIIKEITLNFFTVLDEGDDRDDETGTALSSKDADYAKDDVKWSVNPFTWLDFIWEPLFGFDAEDYV